MSDCATAKVVQSMGEWGAGGGGGGDRRQAVPGRTMYLVVI